MKNTCPFYIVFQAFKVLLIKLLRYRPYIFYFLLLLLGFKSANIIFGKFLELHSTLFEKKIFATDFPVLTESLKLPHLLNGQNPLSVTKCFCQPSLSFSFL